MKSFPAILAGILVCLALSAKAEVVCFDPPLSRDWSKVNEGTAKSGEKFETFQNQTQKLTLVVVVAVLEEEKAIKPDYFDFIAQGWKSGVMTSARKNGGEPEDVHFTISKENGILEAELTFQTDHGGVTHFRRDHCRLAGKKLISMHAGGRGVKVKDNEELGKIFKGVTVK